MNFTEYINSYSGSVLVDGVSVEAFAPSPSMHVLRLMPKRTTSIEQATTATMYKITVRPYMTKPATPEFDFMAKWNNNIPMPLRTMVGTIEKETRGMVYMKLHGDTDGNPVQHCLKCGRVITHPVSKYFGMGVECGGHNYTNPFATEEELRAAVDEYRKNVLNKMTWEGWIIRSAIMEQVEL